MDIYRNGSDAFATLSLSDHDVKKLIEVLHLDANVYAVMDKYFIDDTSYLEFMTPKRREVRYARRRFHRIPFYTKQVFLFREEKPEGSICVKDLFSCIFCAVQMCRNR